METQCVGAGRLWFVPAALMVLVALPLTMSCAAADGEDKTVNLESFDGRPWSNVFQRLGDVSGKPVEADGYPQGTFTFVGLKNNRYTIVEVVDIFNDEMLSTEHGKRFYLSVGEQSMTLHPADANNKRLKQLTLQKSLRLGGEAAVFTRPEVIKELKLTLKKEATLHALEKERRKALLPLFLTNDNADAIKKTVKAHTAETLRLLKAELDADQRQHLQELLGEPSRFLVPKTMAYFDVQLPLSPPQRFASIAYEYGDAPPARGPRSRTSPQGPEAVVGTLFDELAPGNDAIAIADLDALGKRDADAGLRERLQAFVKRQAITNGKLTREQAVAFVEEELIARKKDNPPGPEPHEWVSLLHETAVQEELKMSREQLRQWGEVTKKWPDQQADLGGRQDKAIVAILNEKQSSRLRQLALQQQYPEGGLVTFLRDRIPGEEKQLSLTATQRHAIDQLFDDTEPVRVLIRCELYRVADGKLDEDYRKTMDAFNRTVGKKLDEILTAKQREQLQTMIGEPFGRQNMRVPVGLPR